MVSPAHVYANEQIVSPLSTLYPLPMLHSCIRAHPPALSNLYTFVQPFSACADSVRTYNIRATQVTNLQDDGSTIKVRGMNCGKRTHLNNMLSQVV